MSMNLDESVNRLPPIIRDYIATVVNPSVPRQHRETACLMLENILTQSQKAINLYRSGSIKHPSKRIS